MHKRSFIIGIGLGIIIGVLLLELFTVGEKSQKKLNTIEQQINGGEVSPSPSPAPTTSDLITPKSPEAPTSEASPMESPDQLVAPTAEQVEAEDVVAPDVVQSPKMAAIFRVHPGDSITETGKRLEKNDLFNDSNEFVEYFKKNGVDIRAGFYVEEQMELKDLKKLFTSQPLTEVEANEQITTKGLTLIQ